MPIGAKLEKAGRSPWILSVLGFFFGFLALVLILITGIDAYRENKRAKWPTTVATITQESLRRIPAGSHGEWFIELGLRYTVEGEELASSAHTYGGAFWEEFSMRRWVSHHPPGDSLPIRYDPGNPRMVVLDAKDMPESGPQAPEDLKGVLLSSVLSASMLLISRSLQRRQLKTP